MEEEEVLLLPVSLFSHKAYAFSKVCVLCPSCSTLPSDGLYQITARNHLSHQLLSQTRESPVFPTSSCLRVPRLPHQLLSHSPPVSPTSSSLGVDQLLGSGASPVGPAATGGNFYCMFCRLQCSGPAPWQQHIISAKHLKKAAQAETVPMETGAGAASFGGAAVLRDVTR